MWSMVIDQKEQWNQVHNNLQRRLDAYLLKFSFFVLYNLLEICTWCKLLDVWRGWRLDVVIHQSKGKFIRSNFNIKIEGPLCTKINWQKASRPSSCLRAIPGNWFCHIHSNSPNLLLIFQLLSILILHVLIICIKGSLDTPQKWWRHLWTAPYQRYNIPRVTIELGVKVEISTAKQQ